MHRTDAPRWHTDGEDLVPEARGVQRVQGRRRRAHGPCRFSGDLHEYHITTAAEGPPCRHHARRNHGVVGPGDRSPALGPRDEHRDRAHRRSLVVGERGSRSVHLYRGPRRGHGEVRLHAVPLVHAGPRRQAHRRRWLQDDPHDPRSPDRRAHRQSPCRIRSPSTSRRPRASSDTRRASLSSSTGAPARSNKSLVRTRSTKDRETRHGRRGRLTASLPSGHVIERGGGR